MVNKLCNVLHKTSALTIIFLLANTLNTSATEYVFTAPPEVEKEAVEIPSSDEEYPLYECVSESDDALDSHHCSCADCELELEPEQIEKSESQVENEEN
ncbi:MAG: hypothetical protein AAFO95_14325 [Cyanobacteria bacterium J06600_6]